MNFLFPKYRALCMAENCTHNMHNLYTLRGAQVRDAKAWAHYIDEAIELFAGRYDVIFASHHWPTWGAEAGVDFLKKQRDMYKYLHDETLRLANQGFTLLEIPEIIELPPELFRAWYNRGYYGTVNHNVKAIYQRYLGFFDGNPANLHPLPPEAAGKTYVEFMGGAENLLAQARKSFDQGDYRWVAQVVNHLVFAEPENEEARALQADALEQLGYQAESGPWRNFYLSAAKELRDGVIDLGAPKTNSPDVIRATPLEMFFDLLAVRLNGPRAAGKVITLNGQFHRYRRGVSADRRERRAALRQGQTGGARRRHVDHDPRCAGRRRSWRGNAAGQDGGRRSARSTATRRNWSSSCRCWTTSSSGSTLSRRDNLQSLISNLSLETRDLEIGAGDWGFRERYIMLAVIVDLIPLILGAMLAPIYPIIVLLLLQSERGLGKAIAFVAGAVAVRLLQGVIFGLVFAPAVDAETGAGLALIGPTLLTLIGVLLLVMGVKKWRKSSDDEDGDEAAHVDARADRDVGGQGRRRRRAADSAVRQAVGLHAVGHQRHRGGAARHGRGRRSLPALYPGDPVPGAAAHPCLHGGAGEIRCAAACRAGLAAAPQPGHRRHRLPGVRRFLPL